MTAQETRRLAHIRASWEQWCATADTSNWEATFFFHLLDEQDREIRDLHKKLARLD